MLSIFGERGERKYSFKDGVLSAFLPPVLLKTCLLERDWIQQDKRGCHRTFNVCIRKGHTKICIIQFTAAVA